LKIPVLCPYCGAEAILVDSAEVYNGRSFGLIYLCRPCQAWVGVHKGTERPLGRLANKELREWKMRAHAAFDPMWKPASADPPTRGQNRTAAYHWLAKQLGVLPEACHIGWFDVDQCRRVVEICLGVLV